MLQETFGAMAKTEKIAFILEQVRAHAWVLRGCVRGVCVYSHV